MLHERRIKRLPTGFIIPAQPVLASRPPSGPGWVHEIKHDGYRMIVRRDGAAVRIYSRNANDWTARLRAIADGAGRIKAKSFTIDGEAVVLGPDGLSRFEELSRREATDTAILYAFDLIEHDGEDLRNRPFLERKAALADLLRNTEARSAIPPALRCSGRGASFGLDEPAMTHIEMAANITINSLSRVSRLKWR